MPSQLGTITLRRSNGVCPACGVTLHLDAQYEVTLDAAEQNQADVPTRLELVGTIAGVTTTPHNCTPGVKRG